PPPMYWARAATGDTKPLAVASTSTDADDRSSLVMTTPSVGRRRAERRRGAPPKLSRWFRGGGSDGGGSSRRSSLQSSDPAGLLKPSSEVVRMQPCSSLIERTRLQRRSLRASK